MKKLIALAIVASFAVVGCGPTSTGASKASGSTTKKETKMDDKGNKMEKMEKKEDGKMSETPKPEEKK